MARTGPVTVNTSAVALGLAQVRVDASATHIAQTTPQLSSTNSIGALANTKFRYNKEYFKLESGFPLLEDLSIPLRASAALECAFKELTPFNMALTIGLDPTDDSYATHSGEVALGSLSNPEYLRMEAVYTFPNGTNTMTIVFPRAQVTSEGEMDLQTEDAAAVPLVFEAKRADSEVSGGNAVWDDKPLGRIAWA